MKLEFEAKTLADCIDYLKIEYEDKVYTLNEFSQAFKGEEFQLEKMLPLCKIHYRKKTLDFDDYKKSRMDLSEQLKISEIYGDEIIPIEPYLAICDFSYYKAAKFLEKAEHCLQTARYYLMQATDIIEYDCNIPWEYGYQPIYDIRATNFTTAIVWYNNCFDYILQIAFLAFELFKESPRYNETMTFEETIKLCTFKLFRDLHNQYSDNEGLCELWDILNNCYCSISNLNDWANYAKHKGGIGYIGLKPDSPYQIYVGKPGTVPETRTSEFESIKLDMDEDVSAMMATHESLFNCIKELVDFIGFISVRFSIDENGKYVLPDRISYVKVQLP